MLTLSCNARPKRRNLGHGFTLVELLVVISIIGVLVALLMPAVKAVQESGRRTQCFNNLHQLAQACQAHEAQWHYFPSGGFSKQSVGNPTIGPGVLQPGGWHYSLLPFLDMNDLHDQQTTSPRQNAVAFFLCPTRHPRVQTFPYGSSVIGRSDYAANAGSIFVDPASTPSVDNSNGVIYRKSAVSEAQIKDGDSFTYLIGERFMTTAAYIQGPIENDAGWDSGYDYNTIRWTGSSSTTPLAPAQDQNIQVTNQTAMLFGSAHPAGFHMAFCDGAVRKMNYDISPTIHMQLGARNDGEPTQLQALESH
jgi:prepilin-type N-terminal cleavage/methylation domain-containing protein